MVRFCQFSMSLQFFLKQYPFWGAFGSDSSFISLGCYRHPLNSHKVTHSNPLIFIHNINYLFLKGLYCSWWFFNIIVKIKFIRIVLWFWYILQFYGSSYLWFLSISLLLGSTIFFEFCSLLPLTLCPAPLIKSCFSSQEGLCPLGHKLFCHHVKLLLESLPQDTCSVGCEQVCPVHHG